MAQRRPPELRARRLGAWAYATLALGLVLYIVTIWVQVFIDTRKLASPALDYCSQSHVHWRLRTALLFLIWSIVGGITLPFTIIGWLVLIPAYFWYAYRVIKGSIWFALGRPIGIAQAKRSRHAAQGDRS